MTFYNTKRLLRRALLALLPLAATALFPTIVAAAPYQFGFTVTPVAGTVWAPGNHSTVFVIKNTGTNTIAAGTTFTARGLLSTNLNTVTFAPVSGVLTGAVSPVGACTPATNLTNPGKVVSLSCKGILTAALAPGQSFTATFTFNLPASNVPSTMTLGKSNNINACMFAQLTSGGYTTPQVEPCIPLAPTTHDVKITKTGAAAAALGAPITFTLNAQNVGTATVTSNQITVTDLLNGFQLVSWSGYHWNCGTPNLTCQWSGSDILAGGAFPPITLVVTPTVSGDRKNCAHITLHHAPADINPVNNDSCVPVKVAAQARDVKVTKTVVGSTSVPVGGNVSFTLTPSNVGPGPIFAGEVILSDTWPAGLSYVSFTSSPNWNPCSYVPPTTLLCYYAGPMVAGSAPMLPPITLTLKADVSGAYQNCANVAYSAATSDSNPTNNKSCVPITVTGGQPHDVKITKAVKPGTIFTAGQSMTFMLTPSNVGPGPVATGGVTVTDTLAGVFSQISAAGPGWTCLVAGQLVTCTYSGAASINAGSAFPPITITATPGHAGNFENLAHIQYNGGADSNPSNNNGGVSFMVH